MSGSPLRGKNILFGVCGSIAAFKAAGWVSSLAKEGAQVHVVLTAAAGRFVTPLTFAALSGNPAHSELFAAGMEHIALPAAADAVLIAPATAQTIARLAQGFADDLLSASVLACAAPVLICPAMNARMLAHPATQRNLAVLREYGCRIVEPDCGRLACGEEGAGRLVEWDTAREALLGLLAKQDLAGEQVLITAGPTQEPIDPARFLSNRSSGKMGYALARTARRRGAEVMLISGPVALAPPPWMNVVQVRTALEMAEAVSRHAQTASIVVKAAAVADFRAAAFSAQKIKKTAVEPLLALAANPDILAALGSRRRPDQLLVGFAAESGGHEAEGRRKLLAKNADLIVVNDILGSNTGFEADTNQVTLITRDSSETLELLSKEETADRIWDKVLFLLQNRKAADAAETA
ncbi:MAG: bifunctional phosphopantothenoylcysteine decarboxylase/phosphopantothenate--cysteine ligase CoaBC [Candidatus Electronema sp. V4]|uniref:bifunctional phosphopantothenoylcysteine decarboxylase/phosphopantothenate--cysteine ligase CoaBC n=1 Tax=Candidatus Electronema sp. V4 TaxID=3454756 RepID=UPI00405558DA